MNPIIAMLQQPNQNNLLSTINQIRQMLNGGNTDAVYQDLMQNNPQFSQFIEANKGKSIEQIARENNIDLSAVKRLI